MKYIVPSVFALFLFAACKKEIKIVKASFLFDTLYTMPNSPEALAEYDTSLYGIYKTAFINMEGVTGTMKINYYNKSQEPYIVWYEKGKVKDSFLRYVLAVNNDTWPEYPAKQDYTVVPRADSFLVTHFFDYSAHPQIPQDFSVMAHGVRPMMGIYINGDYSRYWVLKETSTRQVYSFEGSCSGQYAGSVAMLITQDSVFLTSIGGIDCVKSGGITGGTFSLIDDAHSGQTVTVKGKIQGDSCVGTLRQVSSYDATVITQTFQAKRTL